MKNHKLPSRIEVDRIKLGKKVEVGHAFPVRKPEGFRKGDFIDPLSADQVQDVHLISSLSCETNRFEILDPWRA